MHMADALLSPAIGGIMWATSAAALVYSSSKVSRHVNDKIVPLMGVLGAFVFAAQMINFTIPGTGSSGHIGGGLLLAILLGAPAAFLTIASVLTIQAFFFADGGLLALGSNIINVGFFPCFVAYPFVFKPIINSQPPTGKRLVTGALLAGIAALQLGSFGVVLQTFLSGLSELSFSSFAYLMQSIHLVIGLLEGFATVGVVSFVWKYHPEMLDLRSNHMKSNVFSKQTIAVFFLAAAILTGGFIAKYASEKPDGLEWSLLSASGGNEPVVPENRISILLGKVQDITAIMPDYKLRQQYAGPDGQVVHSADAGVAGGAISLFLIAVIAFIVSLHRKNNQAEQLGP